MNYLELVNKAIRESGADLDELTSSNFANPPDKFHVKFKNWVNDAWKEIQLERDWVFTKTKKAVTNGVLSQTQQGINYTSTNSPDFTYPYLALDISPNATNLVAGNWIRGRRSQATARLICNIQTDANNNQWDTGDEPQQGYAFRLYIAGGTGAFDLGEDLEVYSSAGVAPANLLNASLGARLLDLNAYRLTSYNGFNLVTEVNEFSNSTDGFTIDNDSFVAVPKRGTFSFGAASVPRSVTFNSTAQTTNVDPVPLRWLDWQDFKVLAEGRDKTMLGKESVLGVPEYVSRDDSGYYRFYPTFDHRSSIAWDIFFDLKIDAVGFSSNSDVDVPLVMPKQFHDMIAWRAVMYYANDDSKPDKWRTARGRYEFYKRRLEEQLIEQPKWADSPYKRGIGHGIR